MINKSLNPFRKRRELKVFHMKWMRKALG